MPPNNSEHQAFSIPRIGKVLFASYAIAIGVAVLAIVVGLMTVGFEVVDAYIVEHMGLTLIALTIIAFPFVRKHLK